MTKRIRNDKTPGFYHAERSEASCGMLTLPSWPNELSDQQFEHQTYNMLYEGYHTYHIYIITNRTKSVLYVGVTNYLAKRLFQHRENIRLKKKTFAAKYKCHHLLYYEKFTWVQKAIAREKEIKGWRREKKIALIKTINPKMNFLEYLFPYPNKGNS